MKQREIIRTYDDLILALKKRREQLGLSCLDLEHLTGLQSGYVTKIENAFTFNKPQSARSMGPLSFNLILQGLGVGLGIIEDTHIPKVVHKNHGSEIQRKRIRKRWDNASDDERKAVGRRLSKLRRKLIAPEKRSEIGKNAITKRWDLERAAEHERLAEIARKAGHPFPSNLSEIGKTYNKAAMAGFMAKLNEKKDDGQF